MHKKQIQIIILAALVLMIMLLIFPAFTVFEESGAGMLDTGFFYTPDEAQQILKSLGPDGRKTYVFVAGVVDMIYPLLYGRLFYLLLLWLTASASPQNRLAWTTSVLDVLENLTTLILLGTYPVLNPILMQLGGWFNGLKWISLVVLLAVLALLAIRKLFSGRLQLTRKFGP